jgi:hypothetical protein
MRVIFRKMALPQRGPDALVATTLLLALIAPRPCPAQIYKWVDAQGVTHYSSQSPPANARSQTLSLPATAPGAASSPDTTSWQDKDSAFRARYDKQKADEAKKEKEDAANALARRQACNKSRDDIAVIERSNSVYTLNAQGERVYMNDDQRAAALQSARTRAQQNCN